MSKKSTKNITSKHLFEERVDLYDVAIYHIFRQKKRNHLAELAARN